MNALQLKNSILQEAIEGRLVPQDPNDEPASVLLDKIRKEKAKLVKEKLVYKKNETKPFFDDESYPFNIPTNWKWVQLSDVSIIQEGAGIRKFQYTKDGVQLLCVTNILDGSIDLTKKTLFVSEKEYKEKYIHLTPQKGDIVTACSGGSWGKIAIYNLDDVVMLNTSTLRLRFFSDLANNMYLYYLAQSKFFKDQLANQLVGIQPNFGYAHYSRICFPLPPLAEQKRIVEKIEELLPKVEEYGKAQESLDKLNEELPERLKKSILQEAIEGRLVPQDPNEEPASVLLDKIRAEKKRLVKEGKLKKKDLEETPISEDEIPYDIPEGWTWVRMDTLCSVKGGKRIPVGEMFTDNPTKHIYIRVTDMKNHSLSNNGLKYISDALYEKLKQYTISKDDLYLTIAGTIGDVGIVPNEFDGMNLTENAVKLCIIQIYKMFLMYAILSPFIQSQFVDKTKKMAQPKLAIERIKNTMVPLPPLAEQKRIVKKIEQLLSEIDKLKV